MNLSLCQKTELLKQLIIDYQFQETEEYLYKGICPNCHKKELYISKREPWRICCNRLNNCGFYENTYDLYKYSLFSQWSQYYKPTKENPNATADAYMVNARGFDLELVKGLYRQEYYIDPNTNQYTATVRFTLYGGKAQWERFIDNTENFPGQKGRALESYKGLWWQRPNDDFSNAKEIYIVEGIFDALSLISAGYTAIASISSTHYPHHFFSMLKEKNLHPHIIYALDNDEAGRNGIKKHIIQVKKEGFNVSAALPPIGKDWNNLWRSQKLTNTAMEDARYRGNLLLAKSPYNVASIMYKRKKLNAFHLIYKNKTYWFEINMSNFQEPNLTNPNESNDENEIDIDELIKEAGTLQEIANCTFTPLYFQRDKYTDDAHYFMRIQRSHSIDILNTFTGNQLGSATDFKKRLLSICPGALYSGSGKQLDCIIKANFIGLPTVEKIDYTGYVPEIDAWIYRDFAVSHNKIIKSNKEQFISLDGGHSIKTVCDIHIHLNQDKPNLTWLPHLISAFGEKGLVALTFFTGSLFVNQIRKIQKSYPFLEITGDAGTGKTTLIEFLWRLHGRVDYEGFDPSKASAIGKYRGFNKVSGFPVVLIESDHNSGHNKKFDFEDLKDLFNGRAVYTRAVRTSGLETYDPPFRGSIIIAQNARLNASEAIMSRTIPLYFLSEDIRIENKPHIDALNLFDINTLSTYLTYILRNNKQILTDYENNWKEQEKYLLNNPKITMGRIIQNGAQMMTMFKVLTKYLPLNDEWINKTLHFIEDISVIRQQSLNSDDPKISEFWELAEYLNALDKDLHINHSIDKQLIAINLPHFESCAQKIGVTLLPRMELCDLLQRGKNYKFITRKVVRSKILNKPIKCLIFKKGEHKNAQ